MDLHCLWRESTSNLLWDYQNNKIEGCLILQEQPSRSGSQLLGTEKLPRKKKNKQYTEEKAVLNSSNTLGPASFVGLLKACAKKRDLLEGSRIHAEIAEKGFHQTNLYIWSCLIRMYAECGALGKSQESFDELHNRDLVCWTALITGYGQRGYGSEAVNCFEHMQHEGLSPNAVTFSSILKACGSIGAALKGQAIHAWIVRDGLLETNNIVSSALVDMYIKFGALSRAHEMFNQFCVQDAIAWTSLIAGHVHHGHEKGAIDCFEQMVSEGLSPDGVTYSCTLTACGRLGALKKGQELHGKIVETGWLGKDLVVGTALVDMYIKCGELARAERLFHELSLKNEVSWTVLVAGYAQHGYDQEALECFEHMQLEGFSPDSVTYAHVLGACGSIGAITKGQQLHDKLVEEHLFDSKNHALGSALVDMYARCCSLPQAHEVFDSLAIRDIVSWNLITAGYAQLGQEVVVFDLFHKLIGEGNVPDAFTLNLLLNTCNHTGHLEEGQLYFEAITICYGIDPILEHYTCMIDLFRRAGLIDQAIAVINNMPLYAGLSAWHTLLTGCWKSGDVKLARYAFEHAVQVDETDSGFYICLSNAHVDAVMQEDLKE